MIDLPPHQPSAYEQLLTSDLVQCGLREGGFTVKYQDELQSVEIIIDKDAGAAENQLDCIRNASRHEIVSFADIQMQKAYDERVFEALKPVILADARAALEKHGALAGFPERSAFASDKDFAAALEKQCSIEPGTFLVQSEYGFSFQPKADFVRKAEQDRVACLMAAMTYVAAKGEKLMIGFIGNEALAPEE